MALWIPDAKGERHAYEVARLEANPAVGLLKAYRLRKAGAVVDTLGYDVVVSNQHGVECDCNDFLYRRDGKDLEGCKHIRTLREFGLLPELPAAKETKRAGHLAQRPGRFGDDIGGDPLRPTVPPSVACFACRGDGCDPFDASQCCTECGGVGVVPDDRPADLPYTEAEQELLANLIEIDLGDDAPPF
jgi:hypothetical protein